MTREVLRVRTVGVPRIMSTVNRGYVVRALRNRPDFAGERKT